METVSSCAAGRHWPGLCFDLVLTKDVNSRCPFFNQERCTWIVYSASVVRWTWRCLKLDELLPFPIYLTNCELSASWKGGFSFHYSNAKKNDNTSIEKRGGFVFREGREPYWVSSLRPPKVLGNGWLLFRNNYEASTVSQTPLLSNWTCFCEIHSPFLPPCSPMFVCDRHWSGSHADSHKEPMRRDDNSTKIRYDPAKKLSIFLDQSVHAWIELINMYSYFFFICSETVYLIWCVKTDSLIHTGTA